MANTPNPHAEQIDFENTKDDVRQTEVIETGADDVVTTDPTGDDVSTTDPIEEQEAGTGNQERKFRKRAQQAETERDTLRGQLDSMRRAEVERLAGEYITKPAALWAAGTTLDGLLTEDGTIDAALVKDAATLAAESLGLETPPRASIITDPGKTPERAPAAAMSWGEALDPRYRAPN